VNAIPGEPQGRVCPEREAKVRNLPNIVQFTWDADLSFGQLLELLGRMPIPPYLGRDSEAIDNTRYQTVYARIEGSVAAPTAGLHFTPELIDGLKEPSVVPNEVGDPAGDKSCPNARGIEFDEVTLHVGAGTFLPVKVENALEHPMHTEHFEITLRTIEHLLAKYGRIIAVGTTSVRTLESLAALAYRIRKNGSPAAEHPADQFGRNVDGETKDRIGNPELERPVEQFEPGKIPSEFEGRTALETLAGYMRLNGLNKLSASTRIMITPGFEFRLTGGIVTNFHQPKSTLLLLIAAFTENARSGGGGHFPEWRRIYDYALSHDFRFLSYGDSSLLLRRYP
jgi:S-adenosylmethionine:tRNA ribosyltransferase-isomerase